MSESTRSLWEDEPDCAVGKLLVRDAPCIAERLKQALGFSAPTMPNRATGHDGLSCAAVGPGEWMLTGTRVALDGVLEQLERSFFADAAMVLDVSAGCFSCRLSGAQAIALLNTYCPLDLDPSSFPVGSATRTRFGDVGIFLLKLDEQPVFRIVADISLEPYVRHLVAHAWLPS